MAMRCMRAAVGVWLMATASVCFAQVPAVDTHTHDPAKAKEEFEAARKQEKELIARTHPAAGRIPAARRRSEGDRRQV
jgi:hypothetical protein